MIGGRPDTRADKVKALQIKMARIERALVAAAEQAWLEAEAQLADAPVNGPEA